MLRSRFVPANNSRHRTAALALYRALLRTSKQVPLPSKTVTKGKAFPSVHPVAHLVRRRFAKTLPYTSLRLIYAAMTNGYKARSQNFLA